MNDKDLMKTALASLEQAVTAVRTFRSIMDGMDYTPEFNEETIRGHSDEATKVLARLHRQHESLRKTCLDAK